MRPRTPFSARCARRVARQTQNAGALLAVMVAEPARRHREGPDRGPDAPNRGIDFDGAYSIGRLARRQARLAEDGLFWANNAKCHNGMVQNGVASPAPQSTRSPVCASCRRLSPLTRPLSERAAAASWRFSTADIRMIVDISSGARQEPPAAPSICCFLRSDGRFADRADERLARSAGRLRAPHLGRCDVLDRAIGSSRHATSTADRPPAVVRKRLHAASCCDRLAPQATQGSSP